MGSNRRYAAASTRRMAEQSDAIVMRDFDPISLAHEELDLTTQPLTRTPIPIPVRAWVHYRTVAVRVEAELVAWTPRACAVRWMTAAGVEHRAWVWANAVERIDP